MKIQHHNIQNSHGIFKLNVRFQNDMELTFMPVGPMENTCMGFSQ